jgi:4-amino-4-deoxy-L-arabinose transferase-like glycosyltransferase
MRLIVSLLFVVYLGLACAFAFLVPPLEAPDEPQHLNYINYVASHSRLPNQYNPDQSVFGQGHQHPLYYMLAALFVRASGSSEIQVEARRNPRGGPSVGASQTVPRYDHSGRSLFPTTTDAVLFYGLRLGSIVIGALNLLLLWRVAGLFFPNSPWRLFALFLAATLPQFLFLSAVISNDNLANLFATATIYSCLRILEDPSRTRAYVAAGLCLGLGILAKKTILTFVPPVGLVLLLVLVRSPRGEVRRLLPRVLLVPALTLLVSGGLFLRNRLLYGEWLASRMEEQTLTDLFTPRSLSDPYFRDILPGWLLSSFVGRFGWMSVSLPTFAYLGYALLGMVSCFGLIAHVIATRFRDVKVFVALAFLASTVAGIVYYNLSFPQAQGRYLFPVLSLLTVLATIGLRTVLQVIRSLRLRRALIGGIATALLLIDLVSLHTLHNFYWSDSGQYAAPMSFRRYRVE